MAVKIFVYGTEHDGCLGAVADAFNHLPDCQASTIAHPATPARLMREGGKLRRFWHGRNVKAINFRLVEAVNTGNYDVVVVVDPECLLVETARRIVGDASLIIWQLEVGEADPELLTACTVSYSADPRAAHDDDLRAWLPPAFDPGTFLPASAARQRHGICWLGDAKSAHLATMEEVARTAGGRLLVHGTFWTTSDERQSFAKRYPHLVKSIARHRRPTPRERGRLFGKAVAYLHLHEPEAAYPPLRYCLEAAACEAVVLSDAEALGTLLDPASEFCPVIGAAEALPTFERLLADASHRQELLRRASLRVQQEHRYESRCRQMLAHPSVMRAGVELPNP